MRFELPTLIYQEENCIKAHAAEMASFGTHAFIITGKYSSKKNGSLSAVMEALEEREIKITLFDEVEENPSIETCEKAARIGLEKGVDFCIGIGGGSPLDATKAIALLIGNGMDQGDIFYQNTDLGKNALPVICVPTTAGTGSEATPYAILTIHKECTKRSIAYRIFPKLALCDPNYLMTASSSVLISTAVDALAHLIESYLNSNATVYSKMLCEKGLTLWGSFAHKLSFLATQGKQEWEKCDFENMMLASTIAGMAISHTGTSIPHGLSYGVTYETNLAHGAACGLFLCGYMKFCQQKQQKAGDVEQILQLLQMETIEEFETFMDGLLSVFSFHFDRWEENVDGLLSNPGKLKNCPYPITREEMGGFYGLS